MKALIVLTSLFLASSVSTAQDQLPPVEHETTMYYGCAVKAVSEYLGGNTTATEVTDAAMTSCDRWYLALLEAQTAELKRRAGNSIESQQRAEKWARDGTEVRKKVIRDKVLQFVVAERARAT